MVGSLRSEYRTAARDHAGHYSRIASMALAYTVLAPVSYAPSPTRANAYSSP